MRATRAASNSLRAALLAPALVLPAACSKGHEDSVTQGTVGTLALPSAHAECAHAACADHYYIDAAPASCKAGAPCQVDLVVVATGDFHINDEYPYRFKADDAPGISCLGAAASDRSTFSKPAGDWQKTAPKSGTMAVKFTAASPGPGNVSGTFRVSVCSEASCLLEQPRVSARIAANQGGNALETATRAGCYASRRTHGPPDHERPAWRVLAGARHRGRGRGPLPRRAPRPRLRRVPRHALRHRSGALLARREPCYLRDVFFDLLRDDDRRPSVQGEFTRFNLFDTPWEPRDGRLLPRGALIGQEHVQGEIYRSLSNFVREGRPNRLVLLHGPNGSAKSTIAACMMAALEDYSALDVGAVYRFHWVFPSQKTVRGSLGFAHDKSAPGAAQSFAHLPDEEIDAKLPVGEVRDHPLFLVPVPERQRLLQAAYKRAGAPASRPANGFCADNSRTRASKSSRRCSRLTAAPTRTSSSTSRSSATSSRAATGRARSRSAPSSASTRPSARSRWTGLALQSLPASLQAGHALRGQGRARRTRRAGCSSSATCSKRPLDAFKYLQLSVETGEVSLTAQNVQLNCVMMGSANELHLDAFREHAEFASFQGRFELARVPLHLRSYTQEKLIYDTYVVPQVRRHVAPHATEMAALFAVFTRMRKPNPDRYPRSVGAIVSTLTGVEKADLYALGRAPERIDADSQKTLRAAIKDIWDESDAYPIYEGRVGASPREMRVALLDAAQSTVYKCLNPMAVCTELEALCQRKNEFEWLQQDVIVGGYHDVKAFRDTLQSRLLAAWESELYVASGVVKEEQYADLFERYVQHVSAWVKKERLYNRVTRQSEDADEKMMVEVERLLDVRAEPSEWRQQLIGTIAAWALDHPGQRLEAAQVFPHYIRRMREAIFSERRPAVAKLARDIVVVVREDGSGIDAERRQAVETTLEQMISRYGYCRECATDAATVLMRKRFHDVLA